MNRRNGGRNSHGHGNHPHHENKNKQKCYACHRDISGKVYFWNHQPMHSKCYRIFTSSVITGQNLLKRYGIGNRTAQPQPKKRSIWNMIFGS